MATVALTDADRIAKRVSQLGVDLRTDHDPDGALAQVIEEASATVAFYAHRYDPAGLAASGWVQKVATDIAVYYLCHLRLNDAPGAAERLYDEALKQLEKVQDGKAPIPGVAAGKGAAPTVTTQRAALGTYPTLRTERPRSTGTAEGYRRRVDPSADAIDRG